MGQKISTICSDLLKLELIGHKNLIEAVTSTSLDKPILSENKEESNPSESPSHSDY